VSRVWHAFIAVKWILCLLALAILQDCARSRNCACCCVLPGGTVSGSTLGGRCSLCVLPAVPCLVTTRVGFVPVLEHIHELPHHSTRPPTRCHAHHITRTTWNGSCCNADITATVLLMLLARCICVQMTVLANHTGRASRVGISCAGLYALQSPPPSSSASTSSSKKGARKASKRKLQQQQQQEPLVGTKDLLPDCLRVLLRSSHEMRGVPQELLEQPGRVLDWIDAAGTDELLVLLLEPLRMRLEGAAESGCSHEVFEEVRPVQTHNLPQAAPSSQLLQGILFTSGVPCYVLAMVPCRVRVWPLPQNWARLIARVAGCYKCVHCLRCLLQLCSGDNPSCTAVSAAPPCPWYSCGPMSPWC
jgi:hypothetical protein